MQVEYFHESLVGAETPERVVFDRGQAGVWIHSVVAMAQPFNPATVRNATID